MSTYSEIQNLAKSKLGNRGPGELPSDLGQVGQRSGEGSSCVSSPRALLAAAGAEKCECTRPHTLKAVSAAGGTSDAGWRPSSTCSLADGTGGLRGCWARGREGQAWVVGCVCPTRPHAPAWKGAGAVHARVTCPVFLSSQPHTPLACGRSLQAPSPAWTFRRARSRHGAPHLPAAGRLVSSAWTVTCTYPRKHSRMPTHMHANPRVPTHTPHAHMPVCTHTSVHTCTATCTHTHTRTCTVHSPGLLGLSLELAHQLG